MFCEGLKRRFRAPRCYDLSVMIEGVVEVIHGVRTVKERRCVVPAWDICEVEVTQ